MIIATICVEEDGYMVILSDGEADYPVEYPFPTKKGALEYIDSMLDQAGERHETAH